MPHEFKGDFMEDFVKNFKKNWENAMELDYFFKKFRNSNPSVRARILTILMDIDSEENFDEFDIETDW